MKRLATFFLALIVLASCTTEPEVPKEIVDTPEVVEVPVVAEITVDTVPPLIDSMIFDNMALQCFFPLGHETGGEFYYKTAAENVYKTIVEVIENHGENGSDIVLLIDKTGSMANDINDVRTNLGKIINQLEKFEDVQLAVSVYGDKVVDGDNWWGTTPLTTDYKSVQSFIDNLQLSGGGDYPESVYDGLGNAIENNVWRPGSKRMVLVIGDAPSLEGENSSYTQEEIIELCDEHNVKANIFPILITTFSVDMYVEYAELAEKMVEKVYPNPVVDVLNVDFVKNDTYRLTLLSMKAEVILDKEVSGESYTINIPSDVAPGNYVLRVMDPTTGQATGHNIVVGG